MITWICSSWSDVGGFEWSRNLDFSKSYVSGMNFIVFKEPSQTFKKIIVDSEVGQANITKTHYIPIEI